MSECGTHVISPGHILKEGLIDFSEILFPYPFELLIHNFNIKIYSIS